MTILQKLAWFILYLVAFILASFSLVYFSQKDLAFGLAASFISLFIYTLIVTRDFKFLSPVSFFTMPLVSLLILGAAGKQTGGVFPSSLNEKMFMLATSLLIFFGLFNSIFWVNKQGSKKLVGIIGTVLSVLMLLTFGLYTVTFYQNFVYTRINILILACLAVLLIVKRKRLLGILGLFLALGTLIFSAAEFSEKTYFLEGREHAAVLAFINPKAKEMLDYYNKEDYRSFCKYCGFTLNSMLSKNPISANRQALGPYVSLSEPSSVIRKGGSFYVQYPIQFQKTPNLMYVTFQLENINPDSTIYGFSISGKQATQN